MPKTAASRPYLAHGTILRVRPLGEKDRLVSIFSEEKGIIRAVARGARSPKSKLTAITQPFIMGRFALVHGRSLDILTQAEVEEAHREITADVIKIAWASYVCELSDVLPQNMPEPRIYILLTIALARLSQSKSTFDQEVVGHWFETCYLSALGFAPTIGSCISCNQRIIIPHDQTQQRVAFSVAAGGTLCDNCRSKVQGVQHIAVQTLRTLHRLERCEMPPIEERAKEVWKIDQETLIDLRHILQYSLEQHLETRIKSATFLREILADTS